MKIVVNRGRSVQVALSPGRVTLGPRDGIGGYIEQRIPPVRKACGPGTLLEMDDDEAKFLIARGFVHEYEPPAAREAVPAIGADAV